MTPHPQQARAPHGGADPEPAGSTARHGTYAGFQAHLRRGEKPCDACRKAASAYRANYRVRTGETTHALVPVPVLGVLLREAPTEIEEWAEHHLGADAVERAITIADKKHPPPQRPTPMRAPYGRRA